ncbi:MAG: DUF4145 domain-containing protein [Anaerolinea sp.]|nr:DUF4145 domain-containing protein [Anaerolinea sp.]
MPLPPIIDEKIRKQFVRILNRASGAKDDGDNLFVQLRTELFAVMDLIDANSTHFQRLRDEIDQLDPRSCSRLTAYVKALDESYRAGMFDSAMRAVEAEVTTDYVTQAENLLTGAGPGEFTHVPAAVLAGAILEDRLRRLCLRQNPPILVMMPNGSHKTLDPLITDLQKVNVFNPAKADRLRAWAKIRNYAAHGEFSEFSRQDVEKMIAEIKEFLADYL